MKGVTILLATIFAFLLHMLLMVRGLQSNGILTLKEKLHHMNLKME